MKRIMFISWDMSILGGINQVLVGLANKLSKDYEVYIVSLVKSGEKTKYILNSEIKGLEYLTEEDCCPVKYAGVCLCGYAERVCGTV